MRPREASTADLGRAALVDELASGVPVVRFGADALGAMLTGATRDMLRQPLAAEANGSAPKTT